MCSISGQSCNRPFAHEQGMGRLRCGRERKSGLVPLADGLTNAEWHLMPLLSVRNIVWTVGMPIVFSCLVLRASGFRRCTNLTLAPAAKWTG